MTIKEIYGHVALERECAFRRGTRSCDFKCATCEYSSELLSRCDALREVMNMLQAKDPELYLASQITKLTGGAQNE